MTLEIDTEAFEVHVIRHDDRAGADEELVKHIPRNTRPAVAKLGDYVRTVGGDEGVIIGVTPDMCVYRCPDGVRGVCDWPQVMLAYVTPDEVELT